MRGGDEEAKRLLDAIAAFPRGTGTPEEQRARDFCAAFLRESGFDTREEEFSYSAFAGTVATPLAGAILLSLFAWTGLVGASGRLQSEPDALAAIVVTHIVLLLAVGLLATRASVLHLPLLRRTGVNLVAQSSGEGRGSSGEQRLWLVAHLDSKSQPISILARAAGVIGCLAMFVVIILMLTARYAFGVMLPAALWYATGALGIAASVPLLLSIVSNKSCGALDNASGVVAILMAATALARRGISGVGVLITSAEEVGLAGAHAWSMGREPGLAINCDSVDDAGGFLCLAGAGVGAGGHTRVGIVRKEIRVAAAASETPFFERRRLMGILVDSMALEARGWDTVTLCKGTLGSLGRIHTAADTPASCTGQGSAAAAILIRDASSALLARV